MSEQQPDQRYRRAARLLAAKLGMEWHELPREQVEDYIRKIDIARASAEGRGYGAGETRLNIRPGMTVRVVQKQDQQSGRLTTGVVERILTSKPNHPRGIKVRLQDGTVGRVKEIVSE